VAARWFQLWCIHDHGLFLRLALLAAAEGDEIEPASILRALSARPDGLWEHEWRTELLRMVRIRGRDIDRKTMSLYKKRALSGPFKARYRADITASEFRRFRRRAIDEHLSALLRSCVKLSRALKARAEAAHNRVQAQRKEWRDRGFSVGEDGVPLHGTRSGYVASPSAAHLKGKPAAEIARAVREYHDEWDRDDQAGALLAGVLHQEPDRMAEIGTALLDGGEKRDRAWSSYWDAVGGAFG
jgi:hypothetical protein